MNTRVEVVLQGPHGTLLEEAATAAFREMERVEDTLSAWRSGSRIFAVNEAAGRTPVAVNPELFALLEKAVAVSRLSDGCFDISVAALGNLWNFQAEVFRIPDPLTVRDRLKRVGYRNIRLDPGAGTVFLEREGMRISLGGIGKGYAVDRAVAAVRKRGVGNGVISAGGDLKAFGTKRDGDLWNVAVRNPRDAEKIICVIPLSNAAVATSGDYERQRTGGGKRYHHILDPRTGYPARGCMSVSVVAKEAADADALATAVFVLGPREGLALLERLPGTEGVVVDADGNLHVSKGLPTPAVP